MKWIIEILEKEKGRLEVNIIQEEVLRRLGEKIKTRLKNLRILRSNLAKIDEYLQEIKETGTLQSIEESFNKVHTNIELLTNEENLGKLLGLMSLSSDITKETLILGLIRQYFDHQTWLNPNDYLMITNQWADVIKQMLENLDKLKSINEEIDQLIIQKRI